MHAVVHVFAFDGIAIFDPDVFDMDECTLAFAEENMLQGGDGEKVVFGIGGGWCAHVIVSDFLCAFDTPQRLLWGRLETSFLGLEFCEESGAHGRFVGGVERDEFFALLLVEFLFFEHANFVIGRIHSPIFNIEVKLR